MNSMTGFGRASAALGAATVSARVSSVNRKALDLKVSLPEAWGELEAAIAEEVRKVATRGAIQLRVELAAANSANEADFDELAAAAWLERLRKFAAAQGHALELDAQTVASVAGQFRRRQEPIPAAEAQPVVLATVREALAGFIAMRATEGAALLADFEARLALLAAHIEAIAARAPDVVKAAREALHRRLREAGLELRVDDERVLKEVALFADRCDITEELTRFRSHLAQLKKLFAGGGEIGRKAEFILQEMGREVNTTGAKANDYEIARLVIELKNELERIKEQVANVE
ncbi:MAG: YicC family protein [Opitutaceae bacterium]|jgi:uncharacterized protein (TIGR00255 family)|nr:YicC family protein [Opitutaceae bacterium]